MKHCPHCQHALSFWEFITRYGSDTLIPHASWAHPHEHKCSHCHQKVWIHYNTDGLRKRILQTLIYVTIFAVFFVVLFLKQFTNPGFESMFVMILILVSLGIPPAIAYAKYRTLIIKSEK